MFEPPFSWEQVVTAEMFYNITYHILCLMGFIYMYLAVKEEIPPKALPHQLVDDRHAFYLVDAWCIENSVFVIAFGLAVIYGRSEIGRFAALLLFGDIILSYAFIPTQTIRSHRCIVLPELVCRILRNILIAVFLSTYHAFVVEDKILRKIEIVNIAIGMVCFLYGMKKRLGNYKDVRNFPFDDDTRIMGAPDFEYVTSPDHFGVLLQWIGFHIVCGNTTSMAFALYKGQIAIGEAYLRHTWFVRNSPRYPRKRAMIIPHIY